MIVTPVSVGLAPVACNQDAVCPARGCGWQIW